MSAEPANRTELKRLDGAQAEAADYAGQRHVLVRAAGSRRRPLAAHAAQVQPHRSIVYALRCIRTYSNSNPLPDFNREDPYNKSLPYAIRNSSFLGRGVRGTAICDNENSGP